MHQPTHTMRTEEVLLTELHHRFYNSLQVISSLAGRLMRIDLPPADRQQVAAELQERVATVGGLHRLLGRPQGGDLAPVCVELCRALASAYSREDARIDLFVQCPPVGAAAARGILLMLSELVTNAMKHTVADFPLSITVELLGKIDAYELSVVSAGRSRVDEPSRRPRVASELAEMLGGVLAVETACPYAVRVTLPRSCG